MIVPKLSYGDGPSFFAQQALLALEDFHGADIACGGALAMRDVHATCLDAATQAQV